MDHGQAGGFVRGIGKVELRSFGLLSGRLAASGGQPQVFAWVGSEPKDVADRVASLVRAIGGTKPQLRVITGGANNIRKVRRALPFLTPKTNSEFGIKRRGTSVPAGLWLLCKFVFSMIPLAVPLHQTSAVKRRGRKFIIGATACIAVTMTVMLSVTTVLLITSKLIVPLVLVE